jgi:hypothetical protein
MSNPRLTAIAVGAGSLVVGIGLGYKIAEKRLSAQFELRLEKETAGMREFYQNTKKPYATPQEAAAALIDDDVDTGQEATATVVGDKIAYHKIVKKEYAPQEALVDLPDQTDRIPELEHHNVFIEEPIIISQEEFMQNDSGYEQSTLSFYRGDHVLTDERENVIEDLNEVVGAENMTRFGQNSSDPNVLHIRNGRLQMDFEVCLSEGSYSQEVLGIDEVPQELPSGRKRT